MSAGLVSLSLDPINFKNISELPNYEGFSAQLQSGVFWKTQTDILVGGSVALSFGKVSILHIAITKFCSYLSLVVLIGSCIYAEQRSSVFVESEHGGEFDIYKMAGEQAFAFTAEKKSSYNKEILLESGEYLLLADCSYRKVFLKAGEKKIFRVQSLSFHPNTKVRNQDHFQIKCDRYPKARIRQVLNKTYRLQLFEGDFSLNLSGKKIKLSIKKTAKAQNNIIPLATLDLGYNFENAPPSEHFYLTPSDQKQISQERVRVDQRIHLPLGAYELQLQGTRTDLKLLEDKVYNYPLVKLRFEKPKKKLTKTCFCRA